MSFRWVEISSECERERFQKLSQAVATAGIENSVEFIEADESTFEAALQEACQRYDQIRVGRELRDLVPKLMPNLPSSLLSLKSADAVVKEHEAWWPRNYLIQGIQRTLVGSDIKLDLTEGVFIFGMGPDTRAVIGALCRLGFKRFTLCDPKDAAGDALLEELRRSYFLVQFQLVPRHMITQLPSIHSFAVNTVEPEGGAKGEESELSELFFFNFLKPGGVWLDLPLAAKNESLDSEAKAVNATVMSGISVAASTDLAWVEECLGQTFDFDSYVADLSTLRV